MVHDADGGLLDGSAVAAEHPAADGRTAGALGGEGS
jgi:hypothetical protein